jgi:hypothetical protein
MSSSITLLDSRIEVLFRTPRGSMVMPVHRAKAIAEQSGNIAELNTALQNPGLPVSIGTRARVPVSRNAVQHSIAL